MLSSNKRCERYRVRKHKRIQLCGGEGLPTTTDDVLNLAVAALLSEVSSSIKYIPPRRALGMQSNKKLPEDVASAPELIVTGFDGPKTMGHYFGMHWKNHVLTIADGQRLARPRKIVTHFVRLLNPRQVRYIAVPPAGPGGCADETLWFFATLLGKTVPGELKPLHRFSRESIARVLPRLVFPRAQQPAGDRALLRLVQRIVPVDMVTGLEQPTEIVQSRCAECKRKQCCCERLFDAQARRLGELQKKQAFFGRLVDQAGNFMRAATPPPTSEGKPLKRGEWKPAVTTLALVQMAAVLQTLASLAATDFAVGVEWPETNFEMEEALCGAGQEQASPEVEDPEARETDAPIGEEDDGPTRMQSQLNDLLAKKLFCDAPGLSYAEQQERLNFAGKPEVGDWVRIVRRACIGDNEELNPRNVMRREELGQIIQCRSRGIYKVRWELTPLGMVRDAEEDKSRICFLVREA